MYNIILISDGSGQQCVVEQCLQCSFMTYSKQLLRQRTYIRTRCSVALGPMPRLSHFVVHVTARGSTKLYLVNHSLSLTRRYNLQVSYRMCAMLVANVIISDPLPEPQARLIRKRRGSLFNLCQSYESHA